MKRDATPLQPSVRQAKLSSLLGLGLVVTCAFKSAVVLAQPVSIQFTNIWNIAAGTRTYVSAAAGNERGITVNPATTNVILASRSATAPSNPYFPILDGNTGNLLGNLDATAVSGGTFSVNKILAAQDGVIYAANLRAANGSGFLKIYRWWSEASVGAPDVIFSADLGDGAVLRWGDSMAIRGAGTNTQIMVSGSANTKAALFVTADGTNFTPIVLTLTGAGAWQKGLSFGAGNTIYSKLSADATVKLYSFNTNAGTVAQSASYAGYDSTMVALHVDLARNIMAGPLTANLAPQVNHSFRIYDFTAPGTPTLSLSTNFPAPNAADANLAGEADIAGDKIATLSAQNGVMAFKIYYVTSAIPPSVTGQPVGSTNMQGGFASFKVNASGSQPLSYQWFKNNTATPVAGATTNTLVIPNLSTADDGNYFVIVTNTGGSVTSAPPAFLAVSNSVLASWLTPLYTVAPGSRAYLADDNNQRGLSYNSASNHVLVTSRTPGNSIYVLNADTGAEIRAMDVSVVSGGNGNPLNLLGVADDGAVYACNLETGGNDFKIYRWSDDAATTIASVAFENPTAAARLGDSMDVRGSGLDTQILIGEQAGGKVHFFTTSDGINFSETIIVTDATGEALRNGLVFGRGNTYWSKDFGGTLRFMSFDPGAATGTTLKTFASDYALSSTIQAIAFDPVNDLLAGISLSFAPDHLRLFDAANLADQPVWLDTEFFASGNLNNFGTGAIDFGNGRIYALDSHNGIAVFSLNVTNGAPLITVQPASSTNNINDTAIFGVNASGYPHEYQWLSNGLPILDATNASLVLPNAQASFTAGYQVIVTNSSGSVTSLTAQLWLRPIILSPPSSLAVNENDPAGFTVSADGSATLTYQWRKNGAAIIGATDASYNIASAQVADAGDYTVVVANPAASVTSLVATLNVIIPSTPGTGTGLLGNYYNNRSTNAFAGPALITRVESTIDFDWGAISPDGAISNDFFSARWTGQVQPLYSQDYVFYTTTDDGVRLWVNGQKLIDHWVNQPATEWSGTIPLVANQQYDIIMEYYENQVSAVAHLSWSSASQVKSIIPQSQLYPAASSPEPILSIGTTTTNLILTWGPGSYPIQWSTNVAGPYTNVIGNATSPFTIPIGNQPQRFFRLQTESQ